MKILKIGGRNLASLAEPFCVDFEAAPLASSGLFAISGPTGAGKSTLLDALCLALYGATPRLKTSRSGALVPDVGSDSITSQDPRSLLRRGAGEGHAEVDFVGNDGLRYRARWSVRRARSRAAGALQAATMSLHRLPELIAIGATRTEVAQEIGLRIGLSFEQFTRAVLLAQNEFSAFLKTDENERGELLETLTGSVIYSAISRRAFERYRQEQEALRALTLRLADQAPLDAEQRAALDADSAAAGAALAVLDGRQQQFDQLSRWQQAAAELQQGEASAEQALSQAGEALAAAAPRRRRLALLDAVEAARPLLADSRRLRAEQAALLAAQASATEALPRADAAAAAGDAVAAGAAAVAEAEQALEDAAPALDQAKALDAALAALAPAHAAAAAARAAALAEAEAADAAVLLQGGQLEALRQAHAEGAAWLRSQRPLKALAQQWPRWDQLMAQAEQALARLHDLEQRRTGAEQQAEAAAAGAARGSAAADAAQSALQAAQQRRALAVSALASHDGQALRASRQRLAGERESLQMARASWLELAALQRRDAALRRQLAQAEAHSREARAALAEADGGAAALAAAAQQAEAALRGAELACADSVEALRAQLREEHPCPVCGGLEHPWRDASPALHAVLEQLRSQLTSCRAAQAANAARQASASARLEAGAGELARLQAEAATVATAMTSVQAGWQQQPLAALAPAAELTDDEDDGTQRDTDPCAAWLQERLQAATAQLAAVEAEELAARLAQDERDSAQQALDAALARHAADAEAAAQARQAASTAQASLAALSEQSSQAGTTLLALLDDLEAAFADDDLDTHDHDHDSDDHGAGQLERGFAAAGGWRAAWQAEPARFRARRAREAAQFKEQAEAQPQRLAALEQLQARWQGSTLQAAQAARLAAQAQADFARLDSDAGSRRQQRAALWGGAAVATVEAALRQAIDGARAQLTARQGAAEAARLAAARGRDLVAQATARAAAASVQADAADAQLAAWLQAFGDAQAGTNAESSGETATEPEAPADAAALAALLAVPAAQRQAEQASLAALEQAVLAARTLLQERRARRASHAQQATPAMLEQLASLAADLEILAAERKAALDSATALRLQVAQDEVRRSNAQAAMAGIERQQLVERRWGKLSELIGSADGKKFRNYAQQFTLDVLLGYANAHLGQLAKRYRLERVAGGAGPSLGLMVRDQDMGGEVRGVNSLSGGESFLVSLALALGLASLSSNRVKVESLFIDEGFGSLDSETLRVAMDALDGLQAMGRKVGVISHVQEMTERIATRIVVQPAGGGSSSVTVE